MKRRSVLIPLFRTPAAWRYDIRSDTMVQARWRFVIRLYAGWPLIRWGWSLK
jgi:hypothetical protein